MLPYLPYFPPDLLGCCDLQCTRHSTAIDDLTKQFYSCLHQASITCLPQVCKKPTVICGWSSNSTSRLKKESILWNHIWQDCGCPSSGVVFQLKRKTKNRYKHEVRRLQRRQVHLKRERVGLALSEANSRDFWREIQQMKKASTGSTRNRKTINGFSSDNDIANTFSQKLSGLLNSSPSSAECSFIDHITNEDLLNFSFPPDIISHALLKLKSGKQDGSSLSSNHLICAAPVITVFLSSLFTCMMRHGYIPTLISDCILKPIPKPRKDPSSSDSYRPISLASNLSKLLEWCLLMTLW